jgi:uncharacterized protein YjbI with pentapeptide repeats
MENPTSYKLLLIDSRIADITGIVNSTNERTCAIIFNYYHDTYDTILSKLRFLNAKNRVIYDNFYYEEPPIPTQLDASNNPCTPCDDSDIQLLPETLEADLLYGTSDGGPANTETPVVFFQRPRQIVPAPVPVPALPVYINNLDAFYELGIQIGESSATVLAFENIGIIQHAVFLDAGYKLIDSALHYACIENVEERDPNLLSWSDFTHFITAIYDVSPTPVPTSTRTLDLMACALYSNPYWKYVIDTFPRNHQINVRASIDNTGAFSVGGNWILEASSTAATDAATDAATTDLTTVYFTPDIDNWKYILGTYVDNRYTTLRFNNSMYATRAHNNLFNISGGMKSFTIETWYYETTKSFYSSIVDKGNYNFLFMVRTFNQEGLTLYNLNTGWIFAESAVVPVQQWCHIAMTRSGSTYKFFINGVLRQTITNNTSLYENNSNFAIGQQSPDSCNCNYIKSGCSLYNLRIWSEARTDSQIQMYRNVILPNNTTNLVANYLLSDGTSTLNDRTVNALHTTIQNYSSGQWITGVVEIPNIGFLISNGYSLRTYNSTPLNAVSHFGDMTYTDFTGVDFSGVNLANADLTGSNFTNANFTNANLTGAFMIGATLTGATTTGSTISFAITTPLPALLFDGIDDAVNAGIPTWTYSTQFRTTMTVECWFKTADTNNQKLNTTLLGRNTTGGVSTASQFSIFMQPTGEVGFGITNAANTISFHSTSVAYKDAAWHHIATTYDSVSGAKIIYVDGVLSRTDAVPAGFGLLSNNTTRRLIFGSDDAGITSLTDRQFRGSMSDIRIWNIVRSAADISANYQRRLVGNETGLVGYWKLNQGNGTGWGSYTTALDSTINRAHGTLINFSSPSSNWVLTNLVFRPRISDITLGPKNGVYTLVDASFSFMDPSSNSMGAFSYAINSAVATISNSATATTKIVYSTATTGGGGGAITIPTLTTYEFPEIASLTDWQIDISFTVTGGAGTWRLLVGDMFNEINSYRGWGLFLSANTPSRLNWDWFNSNVEPVATTVGLNTPYVLNVAQSAGVITFTLQNVSGLYNSSLSISNLVALYNFDNSANDTSTNNNHLTNNNTVTYDGADYKRGVAAAVFNGSNYFERANDGGRFSPDNLTVACWIKPVSDTGYQSIVSCRDAYNYRGWMIYISPTNNLEIWTGNGSVFTGADAVLLSGLGTLNTWVHIAFTLTKSTSSLVVYINGNQVTTVTRPYTNNTGNNLRIGAGANEQAATVFIKNGTKIDEVRIYNKVLSASEIGTLVADSSYSSSASIGSNLLGKGPVTIGGWRIASPSLGFVNFTGTMSYVNVSVPTNRRVVTLVSSTAGTPATITATQTPFNDFTAGTKTASLTTGPATTVFSTTFAVPANKVYGDAPFVLVPPTSNNTDGAFSYASSNISVATIGTGESSNIVTIVGVGTTTITVIQAETLAYSSNSATAVLVVAYNPNQSNQDLSGVNLSTIDFTNFNFTNANLTNANLANTTITNTNFTNTRIVGATLTGITFSDGQKIQLRQNAANVAANIAAIALPSTITPTSITAIIPSIKPADLANIQTIQVFTPDPSNNNNVSIAPSATTGFYVSTVNDANVQINGIVYTSTANGTVVDENGAAVSFIKIGAVLYRIYAGSIIGIPVDPNYYKVKAYGLGDVLTVYNMGGGNMGATGATGANGVNGVAGTTGATGAGGYQGVTGVTGTPGPSGPQGPTGITGPWGTTGAYGLFGASGPTGAVGITGPAASKGDMGQTGPVGVTGPQGSTGPQGDYGVTGNTGEVGSLGPTGLAGEIVEQGYMGSTGIMGPTGVNIWNASDGIPTPPTAIYYSLGRVAIQTNTPSTFYLLDVSGNIKTAGVMNVSDYRIKHDIVYIDAAGVVATTAAAGPAREILSNQIRRMRPVMFQNTLRGGAWEYGFIAHELQEIFPELVNGIKDAAGEYQAISYHQLFAICCEEIKTLNERITRLERSNNN